MKVTQALLLFALLVSSLCFGTPAGISIDLPSNKFAVDGSQCGWNFSCPDTGKGQYFSTTFRNTSVVALFTKKNTYQRVKLETERIDFEAGVYEWKTFMPGFPAKDAISVGMFLYKDDTHELDFECGYGDYRLRAIYNARRDQALCYATSQANPKKSQIYVINTNEWHTFRIVLTNKERKNASPRKYYKAEWSIDGNKIQTIELQFGKETAFRAMISVEHLPFLGDFYPPKNGYTAYFDSFTYVSY